SDTGAGSSLKEFQDLKYTHNRLSAVEWDGMLSITTTSIGDADIFHYDLNLKESSASRRLTKLPSSSKKNAIFSGTEVSLSTAEDIELLFADITAYLKKMLILKICVSLSPVCFSCNAIRMVLVLLQKVYLEVRVHAEPLAFGFVMLHQNIAVELVDEFGDQQGLRSENVAFSTELTLPSADSSNLERLASGLEEHVFKHGDGSEKCQSCFLERDSVKVGCGRACVKENLNGTLVVEAVMIISESSEPSSPSCLKAFEPKTEVLYYRDFSPSSIHLSTLKALKSIKWTNYGLSLKTIADDETALLEWENFPANAHIDIALHCYNNQYPPDIYLYHSSVLR
ncbi:hypothetical protein KSS87_020711, partial [Heliosperma pusillum]